MGENKNGWGGRRANQTGRPKGTTKPEGQRGPHQIRAYDDEWELVRRFNKLVRNNKEECQRFIEELEQQTERNDIQ